VGKNVAVFVDVANIFYAAKAAGTDIDYVTLLKAATAGRDFVRAYAYTGLDPDNENQRNFHAFLARNHYKVVSKDIRKYGDGKVKANLDIELVVDMMKTARNLDIAIVVSGDGDFAPAIRAVQEMGVRVEVISFRGNTSSDLIDVADLFTDITQLARVDKSSSRSGRRVAGDDEDLSMTEVPDKQTEGTGARGRGRGRGRGRAGEAEPVAASARRGRPSSAAAAGAVAASANGGGSLTVLPGEKLSRVAPVAGELDVDTDLDLEDEEPLEAADGVATSAGDEETDEAGRRRRRRRGGRGRGRGRGRGDEALDTTGTPTAATAGEDGGPFEDEERDEPAPPASRGPRTTPFGSFWDSQLGVPSTASGPVRPVGPVADDEDFDEPEIPEYLIAEQRRGRQQQQGRNAGGRGGPRGGRSAYNAAVDRERYGRGGGGGGINRYPDVSGRDRQGGGRPSGGSRDGGYARQDRPDRPERAPRPTGGDPWSEVPPELEEMLRAQLAQSGKGRPSGAAAGGPGRTPARVDADGSIAAAAPTEAADAAPKKRTTTRRTTSKSTSATASDGAESTASGGDADAAPKKRTTTRKPATAAAVGSDEADAAPKKRTTTRKPAAASADGAEAAAPKKRTTTRKKAEPA
jgi:uncharacterized LabA/DUF88 family protein